MLVIDGHNLIPKIPGWSLRAVDDEEQLIALLQLFTRVRRKPLQVFFDGAPPGQSGARPYGMVTAHFVQAGKTADEAIRQYLVSLKKGAKNVTVVTSDRMVQANARALGAAVTSSEDFARQLVDLRAGLDFQAAKARGRRRDAPPGEPPAAAGTSASGPAVAGSPAADSATPGAKTGRELAEWYDLFNIDPAQAEKPIEQGRPKTRPKKPAEKKPQAPRSRHGFPKKERGE